jgi:hypothetical protein
MKNTTFGAPLLRTLLGAAALLSSTAFAHAANPFTAGSHWTGFRVSTVGGGSSTIVLDVNSPNPSTGKLAFLGQVVPVSISCTATGVVDLQGLGVPYAGFKVHGTVAVQGGTYAMSGNYKLTSVPGMHNDEGRVKLLRSYKSITSGPIVVGTIGGGASLLPPGPCFGGFVSVSGFSGRLIFEHNPPADATGNPTDFTGVASFVTGDGSVRFVVVGTINPQANRDGTHNIELLGENMVATNPFTSLRTAGLLLPAVRTNPTTIFGNYELIGLLRKLDMGSFKVSQ